METPNGLAVTANATAAEGAGGDRPVVVLVHGSLDRSASFGRILRRLADLPVLTYDRRGYGRSRAVVPVAASLDEHADDLLAVIGDRPAVVVGHSFGGLVALDAVLRRDRVGRMVAVGAYEPPLPWSPIWAPGATAGPPSSTLRAAGDVDPGAAAERFFRRVVGRDAWDRLPERARAMRRAEGPALVAELAAVRVAEAPFDVGAMTVPAIFGRGSRATDRHRQGVDWLVEHTPASTLVDIEGAGHGAHLTHPDAFAELVRLVAARRRD